MIGHAVSNVVPVVAANRIGTEHGQRFYGHSFICDERGDILRRSSGPRKRACWSCDDSTWHAAKISHRLAHRPSRRHRFVTDRGQRFTARFFRDAQRLAEFGAEETGVLVATLDARRGERTRLPTAYQDDDPALRPSLGIRRWWMIDRSTIPILAPGMIACRRAEIAPSMAHSLASTSDRAAAADAPLPRSV